MRAAIPIVLASAALVAVAALPEAASAGAAGRAGRAHPAGGFRRAPSFRQAAGLGRPRGLPPIAGIIHEARGMRPWSSAYGHTATGFGLASRPYGGLRPEPPYARLPGYRGFARHAGAIAGARRPRYAGAIGFGAYGEYGDAPGGGGAGFYGDGAIGGGADPYGGGRASPDVTDAWQGGYGGRQGAGFRSEEPLAARLAEPPLAPSPYAPYSPDDRYAYAASEDIGRGPRIISLLPVRPGCGCAPRRRAEPTFYRYGVGTAY